MKRTDYFSIYELYFLLDAFQGEILLGLPSREELTISSEKIWETAKEALVSKGLLNGEGQLTQSGFVITEVLREYCLGESLTVINNSYIMRSSLSTSSIMIVDGTEGYQVLKLSPLSLLAFLQEKSMMLLREAPIGETSFLKKALPLTEEMEKMLSSDKTMVIQYFPVKQMTASRHSKDLMKQLFVVESGDNLLVYHVQEKQAFHYSQYYFLEQLYSWLGIPFRKEDFT